MSKLVAREGGRAGGQVRPNIDRETTKHQARWVSHRDSTDHAETAIILYGGKAENGDVFLVHFPHRFMHVSRSKLAFDAKQRSVA